MQVFDQIKDAYYLEIRRMMLKYQVIELEQWPEGQKMPTKPFCSMMIARTEELMSDEEYLNMSKMAVVAAAIEYTAKPSAVRRTDLKDAAVIYREAHIKFFADQVNPPQEAEHGKTSPENFSKKAH